MCVVFTFSLNFDSFVCLKVYPSCVKQSSHLHKHKSTHLIEHEKQRKIYNINNKLYIFQYYIYNINNKGMFVLQRPILR